MYILSNGGLCLNLLRTCKLNDDFIFNLSYYHSKSSKTSGTSRGNVTNIMTETSDKDQYTHLEILLIPSQTNKEVLDSYNPKRTSIKFIDKKELVSVNQTLL